jgi:DNA-binding winged helix-turn-helix (wHTH) protein/tetratricopeptide (TPR) repeat protein
VPTPKSEPGHAGSYAFGPFLLDVDTTSLSRCGEPVPLTPKVFDTLLALVSNNGRTVSKDELIRLVWQDAAVGDGSLAQNVLVLRKILDPHFEGDSPIATVPKRGYRFTAVVKPVSLAVAPEQAVLPAPTRAVETRHEAPTETRRDPLLETPIETKVAPVRQKRLVIYVVSGAVALAATALVIFFSMRSTSPGPKRRSLAVLALKNLSAKPEVEWYATALAETIAGELRSGGDLRIVSSDSVRRMQQELSLPGVIISKSQIKDIRNDLGCDFVLSGSYLTIGEKIRVELLLSDARSNDTLASITDTDEQSRLLELVSRTGQQLRSKLGIRPIETAQDQTLRHSISADARANRFYFDGLAALKLRDGPEAQRQFSLATETDPGFALAHSALSETWQDLGYSSRALKEAKTALDLADGSQSREDRLAVEAQYYECLFDWTRAGETYRSLWRVFPDTLEYGLKLAQIEYAAGRPAEALKVLNQLRSQPPPNGQDPRIDLFEAVGEQLAGNYQRAYDAASQAAAKAERSKARILLAQARVKQGLNTDRLGQHTEARRFYAEAKTIFQAVSDMRDAADALTLDAESLRQSGQSGDAIQELETALGMSRKIGFTRLTNRILAAYSNLLLNMASLDRKALDKARALCEEAIASNSGINDVGTSHTLLMDRAAIARAEGRYADARGDLVESIRITKQAGYRLEAANAASVLGTIDASLGHLSDARSQLEEAVASKRKLGNPGSLAASLGVLAGVVRVQGDIAGARRLGEEQCSVVDRASCRMLLARLLLDENRTTEARDAVTKLTADFPADSLGLADLSTLAVLQLDTGDLAGAKQTLAKAQQKLGAQAALPDRALPVSLAEAKMGKSVAQLKQVARQAEKLGLIPLALEARMALADMGPTADRGAELARLAVEADQKGLPILARKATIQ